MNQIIENVRTANYGRGNKRIKNVMFCLLVKALLPNAKLAIIRFKGLTDDAPVVIYQNQYWNLASAKGQEDASKLNYELTVPHEISDMAVIRPDMLQSRLDFFAANQVVKMFSAMHSPSRSFQNVPA